MKVNVEPSIPKDSEFDLNQMVCCTVGIITKPANNWCGNDNYIGYPVFAAANEVYLPKTGTWSRIESCVGGRYRKLRPGEKIIIEG